MMGQDFEMFKNRCRDLGLNLQKTHQTVQKSDPKATSTVDTSSVPVLGPVCDVGAALFFSKEVSSVPGYRKQGFVHVRIP